MSTNELPPLPEEVIEGIYERVQPANMGWNRFKALVGEVRSALASAQPSATPSEPTPAAAGSALEPINGRADEGSAHSSRARGPDGDSGSPAIPVAAAGSAEAVALQEVFRRVRRVMGRLTAWHEWYGRVDVLLRNPLPLPPAGDVQALEDLEDAMRRATPPAQTPAPTAEPEGWQPIETAPRGSGEEGPDNVRHPDYVMPPDLLLKHADGIAVGFYDWYYHPGYGRGASPDEPAWRSRPDYSGLHKVTHWMPLPAAPTAKAQEPQP